MTVLHPFVLCGSLGVGLGSMLVALFRRQYQMADQRKLDAQELRTGSA